MKTIVLYFVSTLKNLSWEENEIFLICERLQELVYFCLYFKLSSPKALEEYLNILEVVHT